MNGHFTSDDVNENIQRYFWAEWQRTHGRADPRRFDPSKQFKAAFQTLRGDCAAGYVSLELVRECYDTIAPHGEWLSMAETAIEAELVAEIGRLIVRLKARQVIDAGCGVGIPLGYLCYALPEINFLAYDLSAVSVVQARRRLGHLRLKNGMLFNCLHQEAAGVLRAESDLVFTMNSLWTLVRKIPRFPVDGDLELMQLLRRDPYMVELTGLFHNVAALLRPGGHHVLIRAATNDNEVILHKLAATEAGLYPVDDYYRQLASITGIRVDLIVFQKR